MPDFEITISDQAIEDARAAVHRLEQALEELAKAERAGVDISIARPQLQELKASLSMMIDEFGRGR